MKKHFLITLLLMAFAMAATAQNKKIAILETVDKEGTIPYAVEKMVRDNLAKVISSTPGFEAYERVDMSQIMAEQSFQRTGLVSDDQIKRLGEISGVDYILVSEVAKVDESNIDVSAKILNVETAKIEMMDDVFMGIEGEDIQKGCEKLANKLLGVSTEPFSDLTVVDPKKAKKLVIEEKELISYREYYYYLGEKRLTDDEYMYLINNCPEASLKYEKGVKQSKKGKTLLIAGLSSLGAGIGLAVLGGSNDITFFIVTGSLAAVGGVVTTVVAVPIKIAGKSNQKNAYKEYNKYCAQPQTALNFGFTGNGIGVCLSF